MYRKTGRAAWHWAAKWDNSEILKRVWECAKEKLKTKEINKYLLGNTNREIPPVTGQQIGANGDITISMELC